MFLVTCCSFHALVFGQSTTGELSTSQRKVVWKSHSSDNYGSYGLEDPGATLPIGNSSTVRFRPCFQWSIPDETLPDGCTIDSVRLQMEVGRTHSVDLWFELAKMPYNLTLSATNAEIYQAVTVPANYIIGGQQSTSIGIDLKWYGSNSAIAQAILEQLPSDRFTIGLRSQDEGVAPLYGWWIYDSTVKLTVWYTPQSTTLHQKLEDQQTEYGKVDLWEANSFQEYAIPTQPVYFPIYSTQTVRADTLFASGTYQKHHDWASPTKILNHADHYIDVGTHDITSYFETAHNATVQAQLIDGGNPDGSINFKNPWLRDSIDSKGWLSRGTNAIYHSVSSGTNNVGTSTGHQGVFLNQDYNIPGNPYYSVGAPNPNTIAGFTSYFQKWDDSNPSQVQFQDANAQQTGIVFKQSAATATAKYKAHLGSSSTNATAPNTQRKIIRDGGGRYHIVYESANKIWYTRSTNGGSTLVSRTIADSV